MIDEEKAKLIEKQEAIYEKKAKIRSLLDEVDDYLIQKFFDIESDELLDLKIEVLSELAKGIPPKDIKNYYRILELYPKDNQIWD